MDKVPACAACRQRKTKCDRRQGKRPCERCRKLGLKCIPHNTTSAVRKPAIKKKIEGLERRVDRVSQSTSVVASSDESEDDSTGDPPGVLTRKRTAQVGQRQGTTPSPKDQPHTSKTGDTKMKPDIISRGIISTPEAQQCLDIYRDRLDHFIYRILGESKTLLEIRNSSPLLLAAVCAVGSLHLAAPSFDNLHAEFVAIASAQSFSSRVTTDDVRGLCIGAFWLKEISWSCLANAVRISMQLQLPRSIYAAMEGDRAHYLQTRLYYLLFVCDHVASLPYGRPPMTSDCEAVRASSQFLESKHANEDDRRLVSQVQLWQTSANVYHALGPDVDRPLTLDMLDSIRRFAIEIDTVRAHWTRQFVKSQYVGNYPNKSVDLHSHFAKLYLYSHVFRGATQSTFRSSDTALDIDELANAAMLSATSLLQAAVSDTEMQGYLDGLPTYFNLMVDFAVFFLLKVSTCYAKHVRLEISNVTRQLTEVVADLNRITEGIHPRHILIGIARNAEVLLEKCTAATRSQHGASAVDDPTSRLYIDWSAHTFDNFLTCDFPFLSKQAA